VRKFQRARRRSVDLAAHRDMNKIVSKRTWVVVAGSLALVIAGLFIFREALSNSRARKAAPQTILWAWERPTDLSFIDPNKVSVAFLAKTIRLTADQVIVKPRLQPLNIPAGTKVVAVARIETDSIKKASLAKDQLSQVIQAVTGMAALPNVSAIQIDFDATRSERAFYRDIITAVRSHLPKETGFSITALASWCADDDWISDLPIDEAVPMLFRMGPDRDQVKRLVSSGQEFSAAPCRSSYGVSTDEPLENLDRAKRFYVFNPDAWTAESVHKILESRK
jgi:hypothetical protein